MSIIFACLLYGILAFKVVDAKNDSFFHNWNKLTFNSLEKKIKTLNDGREKKMYKDRLHGLKIYLEEEDREINRSSTRYKFIDVLKRDFPLSDHKYLIIEYTTSGEVVRIMNYVLDFTSPDSALIYKYSYEDENWIIDSKRLPTTIPFQFKPEKEKMPYLEGDNSEDIIISCYDGKSISFSDFFLYATLSKDGFILRTILRFP